MSFFNNYKGQRVYRDDNTFVIDYNGLPYHVIQGDPLYEETITDYKTNGNLWIFDPVSHELPMMTKREEVVFRIAELEEYASPRTLRGAALGKESDIKILQNIEAEIEELREMLKNMPEDYT
ncbi:MAG: hypothetical protein LBH05_00445 [Deferribacteraceae bacterium]|jgi:hypothetical protein|nr:hypothetical protein [Deferribacteraceae bacterium]